MALKTLLQFPICAPPNPTHHHRPVTEIRFSRWKNSNGQKFISNGRTQKEIEDDRRFVKRFKPADKFGNIHDDDDASTTSTTIPETFRSTGTPSTLSRPSVPGKAAKYTTNPRHIHPAFRRCDRVIKIPSDAQKPGTGLKVSDDGLSYVLPDAPFPFQHSYTETPKVKPLKLREPPVAPFGPSTMPRPWTGQKPLPPSKKTLDFDSFKLPPPHKKGVKPVQAPGPFLPGSGPKYVKSREEILGDPLTKKEIEDLVTASVKTRRQLNMGRDGLTHNMLDNIHALWKRRRVCRIKCLGVCTVDMDNVCQQLEEKTGGKIIYRSGGVLYLFRGRNYNYQTRPHFPLMLWRPVTPVYPRLIQRAPEGLTLEEASEMRKKGRNLTPICKLGKNGVYSGLANNVREAFEACELVRINCQGMTASDYRKIGGKLKDLVPCVLLSFEFEHILMWRGRDWKSSLPELVDGSEAKNSEADGAISIAPQSEGQVVNTSSVEKSEECTSLTILSTTIAPTCSGNVVMVGREGARIDPEDHLPEVNVMSSLVSPSVSNTYGSKASATLVGSGGDDSVWLAENHVSTTISHSFSSGIDEPTSTSALDDDSLESISSSGNALEPLSAIPPSCNKLLDESETMQNHIDRTSLSSPSTEGVLILWKEAIESGSAVVLDDSSLDSDFVYRRAVALAQSAPPGPVFWHRRRTITIKKSEKKTTEDSEVKEVTIVLEKGTRGRKSSNNRLKDKKEDYLDLVPQRSLGVDELAKLLA